MIAGRELADERPAAEMWEVELVGLHQVLSAVRDLVGVLGNGAPLYVVAAQWRDGSPPSIEDHPATELLTAAARS